jgi:hypothetical protein
MPSLKRLNSVCHSTAHHAVSHLSYLHPHLRQACRLAGRNSVNVSLLEENPYPLELPHLQSLFLAFSELKQKFIEILESEGFSIDDIHSATLRFEFEPKFSDDFSSNCLAQLTSASGKSYEHFIDYFGRTIHLSSSERS